MNPTQSEKKRRFRRKTVLSLQGTLEDPMPHRMCLTCDHRYQGLECPQCASLSYVAMAATPRKQVRL